MGTHALHPSTRKPLGIPLQYVIDQMQRGNPPCAGNLLPLVREYDDAHGHTFAWGQLLEQRTGNQTVWRVMPVALWEALEDDRGTSGLRIHELTGSLRALVQQHLSDCLPASLVLTGLQEGSRRSPHSLLSLLCPDEQRLDEAWCWIATVFLPVLLPRLLDDCQARLGMVLEVASRRRSAARELLDAASEQTS